jgi:flagellar motor protein MotB
MSSYYQRNDENEEINIWSAFTDLMSNAFMILILLLLLGTLKALYSQTNRETPPIIVIEDRKTYRFDSGSAEISPTMNKYIREEILPEVEKNAQKYYINVVEVIGHTDGQANSGEASNLDQNIQKVANSQLPIATLKSGSNADLGLMRALAVVKVLQDYQNKGRLSGLKFRAYSAGQLILPNGDFAPAKNAPDVSRRRIEIRFTRLGTVKKVN